MILKLDTRCQTNFEEKLPISKVSTYWREFIDQHNLPWLTCGKRLTEQGDFKKAETMLFTGERDDRLFLEMKEGGAE